jgi:hypothetical protein
VKKTGFGIAAVIAVAALSAAAPASAADQKPLSGHMELTNFSQACAVEHTPPFLTWAGTVVIDGVTYGWADFPISDLVVEGKFIYVQEYWTIFTLGEGEAANPSTACDASRVVLAGVNDGRGAPGFTGRADGVVETVLEPGPFDDVEVGSRMFWRGKVTEVVDGVATSFKATLHIQPAR